MIYKINYLIAWIWSVILSQIASQYMILINLLIFKKNEKIKKNFFFFQNKKFFIFMKILHTNTLWFFLIFEKKKLLRYLNNICLQDKRTTETHFIELVLNLVYDYIFWFLKPPLWKVEKYFLNWKSTLLKRKSVK